MINPSVLNRSIRYDNNAIRITCQEVFVDFQIYIKYDMLISIEKSNERSGCTKLLEKECVSQYVKKFGDKEARLLKVDYAKCEKLGYYN